MIQSTALIAAAGTGERFGRGEPKQFYPLSGHPILSWVVKKFSQVDSIVGVVIVVTPGLEKRAEELIDRYQLQKVDSIISGGETRQESVRLGLEALSDAAEYVLVHDAVRPCVSGELIGRVCAALSNCNAVVPTIPAVDTLVREDNGTIDAILDRKRMASVQTPQGFRTELLIRAHRRAASTGLLSSDDGSLVLALGESVKTVPGEMGNIKITYREDMSIAEAIVTRSA